MLIHLCYHLKTGHVDLEVALLQAGKARFPKGAATDTHHLARQAEDRL